MIKYSDIGLEIRQSELHTQFRTHCSPVPCVFTDTKLHSSKMRMRILFSWDVYSVCFHLAAWKSAGKGRSGLGGKKYLEDLLLRISHILLLWD